MYAQQALAPNSYVLDICSYDYSFYADKKYCYSEETCFQGRGITIV